jgi:hypothetical protein
MKSLTTAILSLANGKILKEVSSLFDERTILNQKDFP